MSEQQVVQDSATVRLQRTAAKLEDERRTAAVLMQLERESRHADGVLALQYLMVNQTRNLIAYRQAILVEQTDLSSYEVLAVSNVATVERNAPYIAWIRNVLKHMARAGALDLGAPLDMPDYLHDDDCRSWQEWWPREVYWQPIRRPDGRGLGGLILLRDAPTWDQAEYLLLDQLSDCYGHAWSFYKKTAISPAQALRRRVVLIGSLVTLLAAMFIPIRQSSISPARITAESPLAITAPIEGVIAEVLVSPNEPVSEGQPLMRYEAAELNANFQVAERSLASAEADLRRARQQAFADARSKAEVSLKSAEVSLKASELEYARYLLNQVEVTAPEAGIAIFSDQNSLRGRPVRVGERVMQVADPSAVRIAIDVAIADAIATEPGAEVLLFLDVDPLNPVQAKLIRTAFEAEKTDHGTLAYLAIAEVLQTDQQRLPPRIGLSGSAKIYGKQVPLGMFLFRRPLSALRQAIGF